MNSSTRLPGSVDAAKLRAAQREFLFPCAKPLYAEPLVVSEASGVYVQDVEGHAYLDFFGGVLTTSLSHCHPVVVERVQEQVARLGHTSTLYITENQIEVARKLAKLAPGDLSQTFFTNSGTEAVETAVMLARVYTGRSEIIALRHGYSGRSSLATSLTGQGPWRPLASSAAGVTYAASPYVYRSPLGESASLQDHEDYFIRDLIECIDTTTNGQPAALLAETIQGVGGFIVPPPGYLRRAAEVIRERGGVFICDEIQTGFGRTGDAWFGIEHWGVEPDIMTMAKGIANGFPVGATMASPEIAAAWTAKTFATFGGNPISMAAASATIDVMMDEDVPARAAARGAQLREGLDRIAADYSWIGDVRGMGLMQGLEIVADPASKTPDAARAVALLEAAKTEGLLVGLGGLQGHVIRIGPPMLIGEQEISDGLEELSLACAKADGHA